MDEVRMGSAAKRRCCKRKTTVSTERLIVECRIDQFASLEKTGSNGDLVVWSDGVASPELPQAIWKLRIGLSYPFTYFGIQLTGSMVENEESIYVVYQLYILEAKSPPENKFVLLSNKVICFGPAGMARRNSTPKYYDGIDQRTGLVNKLCHPDGSLTVVAELDIHHPERTRVPRALSSYVEESENKVEMIIKSGRIDMLAKLLNTGLLSDCSIVVGNERIQVHKSILAGSSAVFSTMFAEGNPYQEARNGVVRIDDFQPEPVRAMLAYLYTGEIDWARYGGEEWQVDVARLADKYGLLELKALVEDRLKIGHAKQLIEVVQLANTAGFPSLMKICVSYFSAHYHEVMASAEWNEFKSASPELAMEMLEMGMKAIGEQEH